MTAAEPPAPAPAILYVDTSAMLKLLVREAESDAIERELPRLAGHPMLLAWGCRDFCFDLRFLARWRQLFPKADVCEFAEAGHYVLEDAAPEIVRRIQQFIENR